MSLLCALGLHRWDAHPWQPSPELQQLLIIDSAELADCTRCGRSRLRIRSVERR